MFTYSKLHFNTFEPTKELTLCKQEYKYFRLYYQYIQTLFTTSRENLINYILVLLWI